MISKSLTALTAALCLTAAAAGAQNNSDAIATQVPVATVSGTYSPSAGVFHVSPASISSATAGLANGTPAQQQVAAVLTGGSPAALSSALTGAGAPAAQVNALMSALSNLGTNPSSKAVTEAVRAFNRLVRDASSTFVNAPPAQMLAIRGALISIETSAKSQ
jgi:hypothetical protein